MQKSFEFLRCSRELLNGSKRSRRAEPVVQPHLECVGQLWTSLPLRPRSWRWRTMTILRTKRWSRLTRAIQVLLRRVAHPTGANVERIRQIENNIFMLHLGHSERCPILPLAALCQQHCPMLTCNFNDFFATMNHAQPLFARVPCTLHRTNRHI